MKLMQNVYSRSLVFIRGCKMGEDWSLCVIKRVRNAEKFPKFLMSKVDYQEIKKSVFLKKKLAVCFFLCSNVHYYEKTT